MKNEKNNTKLLITISQEGDEDELFNILNGSSKLPFKLPNHVVFPSGKKEFARRARMLMLAGMEFLKEKYPNIPLDSHEIRLINNSKEIIEKKEDIVTF